MLTCLIFVAEGWKDERFETAHVWAQHPESGRDWYFPVDLINDREDDILNLPRSVMLHFEPLPAAQIRREEFFAYRMGIALMDEDDLNRDWVAAPALSAVPPVALWELKDECDWYGLGSSP